MPQDCKPCPNLEANKRMCTCPHRDCSRHGLCCQCAAYHRDDGSLPVCFRKGK